MLQAQKLAVHDLTLDLKAQSFVVFCVILLFVL